MPRIVSSTLQALDMGHLPFLSHIRGALGGTGAAYSAWARQAASGPGREWRRGVGVEEGCVLATRFWLSLNFTVRRSGIIRRWHEPSWK